MSSEFPNDGMCHETSGFLFNHKCDRFADGKCSACQKPLCEDHTHLIPDSSDKICTTCLKRRVATKSGSNLRDDTSTYHSYHEHYYYHDPYFYGSSYYPGYGRSYTAYSTQPTPLPSPGSADDVTGGDFSTDETAQDPHDFTEGDAESLRREDDADFETDMGAS